MAISYDDYMKARSQKSTANNPKPSTNATSSSNSNQSSKLTYEDYMNRVNANKEAGTSGTFKWRNNSYIVDKTTGQTTKINPFIKQKSKERKKKDEESLAKTGHETFITDIGEALSGGAESWGSSQLSTGATLGLAYNALRNKDNNYTPEFGSDLWKLTHAASGGANYANKLMEGSKEGRGKVGQIVMDVGSQAVMNGIDAAIRSIPGIGQALGTASFMSRSFGGTAQQKRDEGKGIATQVVSGAVSAAIEQFTESASRISGIRNYTGADIGWLDGVNVKLEAAIAKKFGPVIAKLSTSMLSEGLEEVASDILNPLVTSALEGAFKDSKLLGDFEAEEWQSVGDIAYDGLIGALSAIGGGMLEATGAVDTYRTKANGNNELYSKILREEYEADRAYAKDVARGARGLHLKSLFDAVDTLFNRETGESLTERASKAAGMFVSNKDAGKVLSQVDADYVRVVNEVAEKFAEQSFANEAVDKEVLKQGIINFFMNGDFSEDLNSIEGAKGQLKKLAQEIMKADAESRLAKAKSTKNKTKEAYYSSLLANLVNSSFTEESTNANADDITEARTYGYTAEELAADQAAREAELRPEQERPAYVARQEQAQQAQQQEGWVMRGDTNIYDPRNQAYIQKNNPELWAEYQNAKGMSGDAGVSAMRDVTAKMKTYLAEVNKDSNVSWQAESEPVAEQQVEVEADNGQENTISKADQKKLDKIFTKLGTSIRIKADETALRDAVYTRAEAENVDVIEGKYGDRITLSIREKATGNPIIDNQRETKANKNAAEEESVEKLTPEQAEAEADVWLDEAVAVVDDVLSENTDERKQQISELRDKIKSDLENGKNPLYFSTKSQETSGEANSEEVASTAEQADVADKVEANNKQEQINEAENQNRIDSFSGEYDFLNNNYKSDIYFSKFDKTFPSVKAALANKQVSAEYTERDVVKKKFEQNTELRDKLFATGDAVIDNGSELSTILTDLRTELQDIDSPYNNRLRYLEASKSGSFANELQSLKNIESEDKALAEQKKESLLSKFRGEKKNGSDTSSTRDTTRDDGLGDIRPRRPRVSAEAQSYAGRYPEWTNRRGNESGNQENQVTERRTFGKEGQAVLEGDKGKLLKNGMWVFGYHGYRILSPITGSVGDYINRLAEHFGNKDSTILVGGEGGMTVVGNWKASHKGVSTANEIAISLSGDNAKQGINTFVHEETHQKLMHDNRYGDSTDTNQIYQKAVRVESIARGACKTAGLSNLAFKRILATYYLGAYQNTFKADGTYDEFKAYCKKNGLNLEDTLYSLCAEEFLCDITGDTANLRKVINWLSETDTQITEADLAAIRKATLEELQNQEIYSAEDVAVINDAVAASASGDFVGLSSEYGDTSKMFETVYEAYNPTSKSAPGRTSASEEIEIPTLNEFRAERGDNKRENLYEQREGQDEAARQAERLAMDDAEYNELRQADKAVPTLQQFERGEDQPVAPKKASPSEANEIAERSFGKKGRVRAAKVVENFRNRINANLNSLTDAQKAHIEESMGKLSKALEDINDGYGTVKDLVDTYRAWRDDKLLADYYDEDIAARFDKILEDAEAKGWTFEAQDQREFAQAYEEACNAMTAKINNVNKSADRLSRLKTEAIANKLNIKSDGLISKTIQRFIRMQITTDTAMKLFGGFKGSGEFYQLGKDIKDGVAKRMIKYVDAYSHFDNLKKMEGFKEFSQNTKKYQLEFNNEFNDKGVGLDNPLKGVDLSLQQIVTISRLIKTLDKTFEHSDAKAADRVKGFVIRDSNGNSKTIDLGLGDTSDTGEAVKASGKMTAIKLACDRILNQDGAVFEVARAYDKACDAMFKSMGKDVSAVKKALTGNALSLIGEDYTPVLWANDDGSPADFNFNDDDRLRPPAFLYNRTAKQGNLVVSDISYIVDKYIEKAADYIGTAQIKDTLARLNDGTSLMDNGKGLNSALAENFGKDAGTWFDEYVKDLTQYGENDSIWAALRRNMQKGALIGSPSVMMKQTSSYWSAMGLLSPEALAMAYRWKVGVKAADNSEYNKLLKYRHISDNIDPTLTEIIKGMEKYGNASNSRVFQLFKNGISEQDFKTVDNLYTATMIDTYLKNQNKGAEYFTSGEFQNDIDSKFTEVMMRSQPMFDTELRAEYARTDNELVKMTSMFRTQQTQNLNLIATAIGEYNASKGTGEQGEKLKVLQQTVAGQASAALSLALLSVAADFMLHGLKKYRGDGDDDDEEPGDGKIELGRILGRIGLNTVETGAGTVWFGDSVAKWLIDRMSGGETNEFYGLNMGPITTFKNVLDNLEYVAKSPTPSNIKNVATNISQLMGIPLNNAYRIVNSAVMYVEDVVGTNDKNYDDMLKQVTNRTKVNEKNVAGRNLLIESGMTKREATAFVKTVDVDDNGLNKEDLQEYYIEHPEDAERVSILWDSMGWKTKFEKEKKNLDKKVIYNSNPLYAEMDEDESGSVTKSEMMDYALEHEDQIDELSALYKEQGFKGTFRSALKSAENSKLKEQAEDAFYEGDYNVLFDTVSQMKNGKTYLTNLIKDEYDEYDNVSNPLVRYMIDAKRPVKEIDEAVEAYGAKKFIPQYKALRATGLSPKAAIQKLDNFDANANGSITQQELADYYKAHKDEEAMIAEFWKACGWSTTWSKYKKRKKLK